MAVGLKPVAKVQTAIAALTAPQIATRAAARVDGSKGRYVNGMDCFDYACLCLLRGMSPQTVYIRTSQIYGYSQTVANFKSLVASRKKFAVHDAVLDFYRTKAGK